MIINIDESKKISFDINVTGTQYNNIFGSLKININEVEYGFPVTIDDGTVLVTIPPLEEIVKIELNDGDNYNAKLELVAEDQYIVPWEDIITIEKPVSISATIKAEESLKEKKKVNIDIKKINEKIEKKKKKKKVVEKKKPKTRFGKLLD